MMSASVAKHCRCAARSGKVYCRSKQDPPQDQSNDLLSDAASRVLPFEENNGIEILQNWRYFRSHISCRQHRGTQRDGCSGQTDMQLVQANEVRGYKILAIENTSFSGVDDVHIIKVKIPSFCRQA